MTLQRPVWGIAPPLSIDTPCADDLARTIQLIDFLQNTACVYETVASRDDRRRVLEEIYALSQQWVRQRAGVDARCCLLTSGSYRMGVSGPNGDVDALLLVPREIKREDFFADWTLMLSQRRQNVSKFVAVATAFVPIIKCVWNGVDVDILFATMDRFAIKSDLDVASDDDLALEHVHDEASVRSLNGVRVADRILRLVPSVPIFRTALRLVKHWAKCRSIYSNSFGYLGGVAWAIMAALICQLYPNACAATIVRQFFIVFEQWKWPDPVMLTAPSDAATRLVNGAALSMPEWDPTKHSRDTLHVMPVLTPAFPSQNSTFNVSQSTLAIIVAEFQRASLLVSRGGNDFFQQLCAPSAFFQEFANFLRVDAYLKNDVECSDDDLSAWFGLVESRLRFLTLGLEALPSRIRRVCPHPRSFAVESRTRRTFFFGIEFVQLMTLIVGKKQQIDISFAIEDFNRRVFEHADSARFCCDVKHVKRSALPSWVNQAQ